MGAQDGAGTRPRTGRPRGSRGTWDRMFRRKCPGGLGAALGSGSSSRGPRFPPPEGVVESVAQVLGSWDDRRMRGGTGHGQDAVAAARAAVPAAVALGAGGFCPRTGLHSVPPAASHGWGPTSARPGASPGVCTERGARQPPPRLSAHCGRACAKGPGVTSEDRVEEESQCPRGSRSTCVGVGGGQLCGGGGVLRSPEVLTPMPGALSGVSSRLGVIRPPLPAQASRRLRQPSVTGIPATWARAAPETPLARRLRRAAANTCGGRGPALRSAQASPAARPEQLITPAPGREALPGPLFSTCLPGACE